MSQKPQIFPALTGFRAIAAYMVFMYHFISVSAYEFHPVAFDILNEFHVGVTFFFVLSGFLIAYRYANVDFKYGTYFNNRLSRIYPVYFILTLITFLQTLIVNPELLRTNLKVFLTSITFTRAYFQNYIFSGIGQGWSLTVEMMFYIFAPLFMFFFKRNRIYFIILPILFVSIAIGLGSFFENRGYFGFLNSVTFMLDFSFFGRVSEFVIGMGLAYFYTNYSQKLKTKHITTSSVIVIFILIYCMSVINTGDGTEVGIVSYWGKLINNLILPFFGIAPLLWGLMTEKTWFARLLSTKLMMLLGSASYVFYLIHVGLFSHFFDRISNHWLFGFVMLNLTAIAIYKLIEVPLNKYFRKL